MKGYTALSLLGLTISLSGTVIISRYLYQEWTIDHWMPDLDRTYILCQRYVNGILGGETTPDLAWNPNKTEGFVSPTLGQSDVEAFSDVHLLQNGYYITLENEETITAPVISVDSSFVDVFPLQALEGTLVLRTEGQAIVSDDFARRHFPGESAVGKTMKMGDENTLHTIVGVFRQPSSKSTIHFDVANYARRDWWVSNALNFTMIKLAKGASMEAYNERQPKNSWGDQNPEFHFMLVPYTGNLRRLVESYGQEFRTIPSLSPCSSPQYLWMLFAVAVLLFLVGIFNFLNLFAVMRSHRRHELEVRRLFGASRLDIFSMLYMENLLISALAMLGVWMVVELITPHMKDWFSIEQMSMPLFDTTLSLSIIFILPLIAIVGRLGKAGARSFLFLQYFISITLITVSLYLMRQLHFMMGSDPGYHTENILNCTPYPSRTWTGSGGPTMDWFETMKNDSKLLNDRLTACPHIKSFCSSGYIYKIGNELSVNNVSLEYQSISPQQMEMYGLEVVQGRAFNDTLDTREQYRCLLNETAIRQLGIKDIEKETVLPARRLWWIFDYTTGRMPDEQPLVPYEIVGVIRDYHPGKLSEPQPGMFFAYRKEEPDRLNGSEVAVEVMPGHEKEAIEYIQKTSREIFHVVELPYHWLKDDVASLYEEDRRTARIFFTFSLLAIAVTCLGVLGLMMFDVRRRYREIALRKVNGATFRDIALLLSRRYLIILAVAAAVSIPVSLIGLHQLITRYYTIHATIAWWIPLVSIAIVLLLCALTLWQQVWKATRIKPYEVLKEQ